MEHPVQSLLIADDNEINLQYLGAALKSRIPTIELAHDGLQAVSCCENRQYDVVFMDIRMPHLDGIAATKLIRELPMAPERIIALTAEKSQDENDGLEDLFDAVLIKPISRKALLEALQLPVSELQESKLDSAPLDDQKALSAAGGNQALVNKLRDLLVDDLKRLVPLIDEAIANCDAEKARDSLHKIAGASGFVGAIQLQLESEKLGESLREKIDQEPNLKAFHQAVRSTIKSIRSETTVE